MNRILRFSLISILVFSFVFQQTQAYTIQRITNADGGGSSNGYSSNAFISRDGRFALFDSNASNLVSGDTNAKNDVFLYDISAGTTTRVSLADNESQANNYSYAEGISEDGRYVLFSSGASNLVAGDVDSTSDLFIRDIVLGTTELVSVSTAGVKGNSYTYNASLSPDARYVTFFSGASNLVIGDSNARSDIFLRDRIASTTEIISVKTDGTQGTFNVSDSRPVMSDDGRYVVFISGSSNLVDGDTNGSDDVFIRDRTDVTTEMISVTSLGVQTVYGADDTGPSLAISPDGRYVVFASQGNLAGLNPSGYTILYIKDTQTGDLSIIESYQGEAPNEFTVYPKFSADGNFIVFSSNADNLTSDFNNDNYFYVWNMTLQKVERVSFTYTGSDPNDRCGYTTYADISSNGDFVVMGCRASNMVSDSDTNGTDDMFITYWKYDDYGDANESYFATEYNSDGARHRIFDFPSLYLGQTVDKELDAATSTDALGDDTDGVDDEDGVQLPSFVYPGQELSIPVSITGTGYLNVWSDNNNDGDWNDSGEQIVDDQSVTTGTTTITTTFSLTASTGDTTLRFRLTSATGTEYTGTAKDGEVEDYKVTISTDADSDKVPDGQELIDSSLTDDALDFLDTDGDLVPDYQEVLNETDKNNSLSFKDTDGGGVPDYVEVTYFANYGISVSDIAYTIDDGRDTNGNGISDYAELLEGLNPSREDITQKPSGTRDEEVSSTGSKKHSRDRLTEVEINHILSLISNMLSDIQVNVHIDIQLKRSLILGVLEVLMELNNLVEE